MVEVRATGTVKPRVRVLGTGMGHQHVTPEVAAALRGCDYVIAASKGEDDALLAVRRAVCEEYGVALVVVPDPEREREPVGDGGYLVAVRDWHEARVAAYREVLDERPGTAAFLVWGDPTIYDGTLRILKDMQAAGWALEIEVIPGISAPQALAARHQVTLNRVGEAITITTGRRVAEGEADALSSAVVMLDNHQAFRRFAEDDAEIFWGAYLGTADEILVSGKLAEVMDEIAQVRSEAQARNGWIMDTYLIRKPEKS